MNIHSVRYVKHEATEARRQVAPARKPARPVLPEPGMIEMAVNVTLAAAAWIAAGYPVVTQQQYDERGRACAPCELWDGSARGGLGKCKAPGCGCTKLKRWLATERCKHPEGSRWPALPQNATAGPT